MGAPLGNCWEPLGNTGEPLGDHGTSRNHGGATGKHQEAWGNHWGTMVDFHGSQCGYWDVDLGEDPRVDSGVDPRVDPGSGLGSGLVLDLKMYNCHQKAR